MKENDKVRNEANRVKAYDVRGKTNNKKITFVIGGFQGGHFSQSIRERFQMTYSIAKEQLEAHVVISRLVYECENRCLSFMV